MDWDALLTSAHAWQCCPEDVPADALERRCLGWLTADERGRRDAYRTDDLRHLFLTTRALCRQTLSRYTRVDPADWKFRIGPHGKPVTESPSGFESLQFNLAHTQGLVVCLVTRAGEVGVDVEEKSRVLDFEQIMRQFLTPQEQADVMHLPPAQRMERFYELWVLKEAYLKGRGLGLSEPPDAFAIDWDSCGQPRPLGEWHLALHRPSPRHIAATAIQLPGFTASTPITWFSSAI